MPQIKPGKPAALESQASKPVEEQPSAPAEHEPFVLGTHAVPRHGTNWRLEAVRQVRLLVGQGYRRISAQQQIAASLSRSIDDLQAWERELVQNPDIENDLLCSEFAGELLEHLRSGHYTNVPHYKSYGSFADRFNVARAAGIAKTMRQYSLTDIRTGLRSARRQRPNP